MKNLPPRWKYGLVAVLATVGIASASASNPTINQSKATQTAAIEERVNGAQAPTVSPANPISPTKSPANLVTPSSSPLIRALIPTNTITPSSEYIPPTQVPLQQPEEQAAPVYSDKDKDCSDFATHAEAQAFFEAAGAGDPHRLDQDGDGVACETLH